MKREIKIGDKVICGISGVIGIVEKFYYPTSCKEQTMIICAGGRRYHAPTDTFKKYNNITGYQSDFVNDEWYQLHIKAERHHLLSNCPDDVNLIDVLEMIADCVCAGMARSGEIRDLEINSDILNRAVQNTANTIKQMIVVK